MRKILTFFFVALFSASMFATNSGTFYVTGAVMYADGWDYSTSDIRYAYNYWDGSATQWTGDPATMTNTGETYHTYPVYSGEVSSEGNDVKVFFYHFKNGTKVDGSDYQASAGDSWVNIYNNDGKIYNGWHNSTHEWLTIDANTYDVEETFTVYYVCANTEGYTIKANVRVSQDYNVWKTYAMTNTGKTHGGVAIYSGSITTYRGGALNLQFQRYDGETHKDEVQPIDGSAWTANSVFSGKMWDGSAWITYSDDSATALDETEASAKAVKRIVDGKLVIMRDGKTFNALGVEVK